jgi:NADP-dependent 3-hydroxy acid dehydrogenase YdfG/acyl carrier protein
MGPGAALGSLALQQAPGGTAGRPVVSALRHDLDRQPDSRLLMYTLGRLWLDGLDVEPEAYYRGERRRRVPLPPYPFERRRFWVESGNALPAAGAGAAAPAGKLAFDDWFYLPSWRRAAPPPWPAAPAAGTWLVLAARGGPGHALVERLKHRGHGAVLVEAGDRCTRHADGSWTLDPARPADHAELFGALREAGQEPAAIVHAWSLRDPRLTGGDGDSDGEDEDDFDEAAFVRAQQTGLLSLLHLLRQVAAYPHPPLQVFVLGSGLFEVTGSEPLRPAHAGLAGAVRVVPQEDSTIGCRLVDIDCPGAPQPGGDDIGDRLLAELCDPAAPPVVAWRGAHRWVQSWERTAAAVPLAAPIELRRRGVYLITGGLGNIGLTLAELLAESQAARLVLVGRTPPAAGTGGERRLRALEALGAEVFVAAADIVDREALGAVVRQAEERFGRIDGVIHAAGHVGLHTANATGAIECAAAFHARLHGARALAHVLRGRRLDFVLVSSSLSPLLGGLGFTAYAASNFCLDAFVLRQRRTAATPWIGAAWDGWRFGDAPAMAIDPPEGKEVFRRILALGGPPQVAISVGDLDARLARWVRHAGRPGGLDGAAIIPAPAAAQAMTPLHARPDLASAYQAPRGELESTLAGLCQDLLGIERIGAHDSFFELGGHSLMATRLLTRIQETFGVTIALPELFTSPTVAELAKRIATQRRAAASRPQPPLVPLPRGGTVELSFAQQRLWFIDQLQPGTSHYNIPVALRVTGRFDAALLAAALGEIVRRHQVLRTAFVAAAGSPHGEVRAAGERFALDCIDLARLPAERRMAAALALAGEETRRPFLLDRPPLLRGALLRLAADEHIVVLTVHHAASDGWSMDVLVHEVTVLYEALRAGRASPLRELPIQYADFAAWQRRRLDADTLEGLEGYWRQHLAGAPAQLDLQGARPRPAVLSPRGAACRRRLAAPLTAALRALGRSASTTLFMTLLAPLAALLHRASGATDLVVGTDVAGRERREIEELIGFFINQLPLRIDLAGDPTLFELLGRVRETALAAYAHQELPFDRLTEALAVKPSLQRSPVFQVKLLLKNARPQAPGLADLTLEELPIEVTTAQLDLHCSAADLGDEIELVLAYSSDLFDPSRAVALLDEYAAWLAAFTARPTARLGEVAGDLARAERDRQAERELAWKAAGLARLRDRRRTG